MTKEKEDVEILKPQDRSCGLIWEKSWDSVAFSFTHLVADKAQPKCLWACFARALAALTDCSDNILTLSSLSFPFLLEYAAINSMLDQINSCLDHLEEKNDYLHACLKELLESNRQTRLEFQQQSEQQNTEADVQGSQPPA
nr:PREDICTED: UPF0184 protein C9orf16 homolog [Balearica regulorum gibbericeps]